MPRTSHKKRRRSAAVNNGAKSTASSTNAHETTLTNDVQLCKESSPQKHHGHGNRENGTASAVSNGTNLSPSEVRVVGARMSGVKHSGLLARDEEELLVVLVVVTTITVCIYCVPESGRGRGREKEREREYTISPLIWHVLILT